MKTISLRKTPTGITGLDEITGGGLPAGRPTLVCGDAGCGKTLFSIEFLVRGALKFGEPGVFMSFEEREKDLSANVASLGFNLERMKAKKQILVDYVRIERSEIEETGEYDLEGLFVRLGHAIDTIGAKRVVLDTVESLFAGLSNTAILRAELRRLFNFLKDKGVTAVVTGERGEGRLTRHGLEEYVSDCVILLDHRIEDQISTRRLRIVKYRGSSHGTNEYPFLIDEKGIAVMPITSLGLQHGVSKERIATGIPRLDAMMGDKGFFRGSSILVSGTAGTGKTTVAASFADSVLRRGEKCLYFAFEESPGQILRNMRSIGLNLEPWVKSGHLEIHSARPALYGLEMHLAMMHKLIEAAKPTAVVIDPVNNLLSVGTRADVHSMLVRLVDYLKTKGVTAMFTDLSSQNTLEETDAGISSIMDCWILLRDIELGGERNRALYILKSRGMAHSNQIREFLITNRGIELVEVYVGPEGVLTGSARASQEARLKVEAVQREQDIRRRKAELSRRRQVAQAQVAAYSARARTYQEEMDALIQEAEGREAVIGEDRRRMAQIRKADKKNAGTRIASNGGRHNA